MNAAPANTVDVDVAVLGSGFAGSLTALCLRRMGRTTALLDQATHPRFAIGESSTPIANMVLRELAKRYDLPRVLPLAKFGTWQATHPELTCGLKRGFSYFAHQAGADFTASSNHDNELLVAASATDEQSDTHWLRADVDQFLFAEAQAAGAVALDGCEIRRLSHLSGGGWRLECQRDGQPLAIQARLVVDGSGAAGLVPRALGIPSAVARLATRSRAVFTHLRGVHSWHEYLQSAGAAVADHPFHCDHAAQHHILDGAWLWMLRFTNGVTSVGLVLDGARHPLPGDGPSEEWTRWLGRYPSLAAMFAEAELADQPGRWIQSGRLQRRWMRAAGADWALLPHTAGFIDPLHSTGIAHSLCGVERLLQIVERQWEADSLAPALAAYDRAVQSELDLIDELVSGCFAAWGSFERLIGCSMLYFAAATTYEHHRAAKGGAPPGGFLCADRDDLRRMVRAGCQLLERTAEARGRDDGPADELAALLKPFNRVGLMDREARNMYPYTVAPIS